MEKQVVIVGGGVGGLAMALALANRNIASVIIERRRQVGEVDRGDILHHGTLRLLRQWRLMSELEAAQPFRFKNFRILDSDGKVLFRFELQRELGPDKWFTSLRHPAIETVLEQGATRNAGLVHILRGSRVKEAVFEHDRIVGVRTTDVTIRGQLTVFATGAGSHLTDSIFPGQLSYDYDTSFYNVRFRLGSCHAENGAFYILGRRCVLVGVPLPENEIRLGIQYHRKASARSINANNFLEYLRAVFPSFPLDEAEIIDHHMYKLKRQIRYSFWRPGAVTIGDAAHTIHPVGGQGMNLALQDAERLAEAVAESINRSSHLDEACSEYDTLRRRELRPIFRRTHLLGIAASWRLHPLVEIRRLSVRSINYTGPLKRYLFKRIIDVA